MIFCEKHSRLLALAHALYPGGAGGRVLFMFTAYLDDSGTHEGSLNVTVGGCVADVQQWQHFDREWSSLLEEFDLFEQPGYIRMADFEARQHPYGTWDNIKRKHFMVRLTGIIKRRVRACIAASLPAGSFDRMRRAMPDTFPAEYPYYTCAQICWRNIGQWAKDFNHDEAVSSVFEEGSEGKGLVLASHADLMKHHPDRAREYHLGEIAFGQKRVLKPLQAADFFAYETYKRMIENLTDERRWRRSVEAVISDVPVYATFLGDKATDDIVSDLERRRAAGLGLVP